MIISASRRTDIPAFYSSWLLNRFKEGFVYTKNPLNAKQISRVALHKDAVDCIVFWTKNAAPIINKLDIINAMGYQYYFQFTLNPYGSTLEKHLKSKDHIIEVFQRLSSKIGKERVIWRYDPVIVNRYFSLEYHLDAFGKLCGSLSGFTDKCVFSFVELYTKVKRKTKNIVPVDPETMNKIARGFSFIAGKNNIILETCSATIDFSKYGINASACIDRKLIEDILGCPLEAKKDPGQRQRCQCIQSIDIGSYDCCAHGCVYCYATANETAVYRNIGRHDAASPLLLGWPPAADTIADKKVKSLKRNAGTP